MSLTTLVYMKEEVLVVGETYTLLLNKFGLLFLDTSSCTKEDFNKLCYLTNESDSLCLLDVILYKKLPAVPNNSNTEIEYIFKYKGKISSIPKHILLDSRDYGEGWWIRNRL